MVTKPHCLYEFVPLKLIIEEFSQIVHSADNAQLVLHNLGGCPHAVSILAENLVNFCLRTARYGVALENQHKGLAHLVY